MMAEIRASAGAWDLLVDGEVRIRGESYAVVSQVEEAINGKVGISGECREVAESIRRNT